MDPLYSYVDGVSQEIIEPDQLRVLEFPPIKIFI